MKIKIPDCTPEQKELFRTYLGIRQFVGLSWDSEQQLAAGLLAAADELRLTPRQIETLKELVKSPLEQLCDSTKSADST